MQQLLKFKDPGFWFYLWCVKRLEIITPTLTIRKKLNELKINDFFDPSEN